MQHVANLARREEAPREEIAIEVAHLSHVYAGAQGVVPALEDISMRVGAGRFVVIVGPSGCGKTSLLMMLAGLRSQSQGTILCHGRPIPDPDPQRVGVIFQEASLYPWLTALDNIEFPLSLRGARDRETREERRERAEAMLRLVGLEGFGERFPHELSGGMKQRVSIVRAFANDPEILLMDEPFSALDEQNKLLLHEELLRIWEATKKTVVFITHSVDEAVTLGDRILVMTANPGRAKAIIDVPFERPRNVLELRHNPAYGELVFSIWEQLRDEVQRARLSAERNQP